MSRQKQCLHKLLVAVGCFGGFLSFYISLYNIAIAFGPAAEA